MNKLAEKMQTAEELIARDLNRLLYPNGRQEAYDRISRMCGLTPESLGTGPISREPGIWKNRHL